MDLYGLLRPSMAFYGLPWPSMAFHGLLWPPVHLHVCEPVTLVSKHVSCHDGAAVPDAALVRQGQGARQLGVQGAGGEVALAAGRAHEGLKVRGGDDEGWRFATQQLLPVIAVASDAGRCNNITGH